jgi:hypothetical protein
LGTGTTTLKSGQVAIGYNAYAGDGDGNVAIGASTVINTTLTNVTIVGASTTVQSTDCIAVGKSSSVDTLAANSTLFGNSVAVPKNYTDCVFLGSAMTLPAGTISRTTFLGNGVAPAAVVSDTVYLRKTMATGSATAAVQYDSTTGRLYPISSSRRYKEDFQDVDKTSRVLDVKIYNYQLKPANRVCGGDCKNDYCKHRELGVIAEEIMETIPEVVSYSVDPETNKTRVEAVQYERLLLLLIPEMRKLRDRVEALEAQLSQ